MMRERTENKTPYCLQLIEQILMKCIQILSLIYYDRLHHFQRREATRMTFLILLMHFAMELNLGDLLLLIQRL